MKQSRFFCEHCGAEVERSAKQCSSCGKFFSSILCPSCGFSGEEFLFDRGCPVCGYSSSGKGAEKTGTRGPGRIGGSKKRNGDAAGALPWWVYVLTALAVSAVLFVFIFRAVWSL
jgi:hypothetical protein